MKEKNDWLEIRNNWIVEVDITYRCNLKCDFCNRLCNAEGQYNVIRSRKDMTIGHIHHLCNEILKFEKGKVRLIRILGGEPLLSPILADSISLFKSLIDNNYITEIQIVTNGTINIPENIQQYCVFSPEKVGDLYNKQTGAVEGEIVSKLKVSLRPSTYFLIQHLPLSFPSKIVCKKKPGSESLLKNSASPV